MARDSANRPELPLAGVRVIEFSQMVMGPSCGMILGDLGADVIKIEPIDGDRTRRMRGTASGFFHVFNRNKRSVAIDIKSADGLEVIHRLLADADVLIENFRPGLMARSGLDHQTLASRYPRLIYCSLKGFLPGPYEARTALDEVVQMMGGLAYMTGPPGQPMRAGASVNDIMGGMFGVIAIQAALARRQITGQGQLIQSALYENNVFLMGQAMMFEAVTGRPCPPWSVREAPWPVYDLFQTGDGKQIFVTIVGEEHWRDFCAAFDRKHWLEDPRLATAQDRVDARSWLLPEIAGICASRTMADLTPMLEAIGLPFAPVRTPHDLLEDPHLLATGGLLEIALTDGGTGKAPALPFTMAGQRPPLRRAPPAVGADSDDVLADIGFDPTEIARLRQVGVIGPPAAGLPEPGAARPAGGRDG